MRFSTFRLGYLAGIASLVLASANHQHAQSKANTVSFFRDIAPILVAKCQTCHSADKPKGKYQLHTFEMLLKPGASGESPLVAGKPEKSYFHQLLIDKDPDNRMPQKDDPLPKEQIALITRWIKEGARFDGSDTKASLASVIPRVPHPEPPVSYPFPVPITAMAFHPQGGELFVSGYHEVTVWDGGEGKLLRRIKGLPRQVQAIAFPPDGKVMAVAGGTPGRAGELALVEVASGKAKEVLLTLNDLLLAAAFSPDGKVLAAAGSDNAIHLFEMPSGRKLLTIAQHADWVMNIAFSPDGKHIASASRDRTARLFDVAKGELEATYTGHEGYVNAVAFAVDGKSVFSAGRDKKIGVWKVSDGNQTATIKDFEGEVFELLVVGDFLASASADKRVRLHKLGDRALARTLEGHGDWVYSLAVDVSNQRLASGSFNGEVRVWNLKDGSLAAVFTAVPGLVAKR